MDWDERKMVQYVDKVKTKQIRHSGTTSHHASIIEPTLEVLYEFAYQHEVEHIH